MSPARTIEIRNAMMESKRVLVALGLLVGLLGVCSPMPGGQGEDIIKASGVRGGLVVHVGCDNPSTGSGQAGKLTAALHANDSYLVQGITTNPEKLAEARSYVRSKRLYGKVSIARFDGRRLPYVDNLVNLLVADDLGGVTMAEVMRVLAPGGVAIVGGKTVVKKVPAQIDEWSHHMYDATGIGAGNDTAVSQPRSIQWKAGPEYGRSHENMSSVSAVVSAGGRVFSIMDEGPKASIYLPAKWMLTARDAFSGVRLWQIPIGKWHARLFPLKSGPMQLPRRLVAGGGRLYATLGLYDPVSEIDAATGKVLRTCEGTAFAEELLLTGGKLVVLVNDDGKPEPYQGRMPAGRQKFRAPENTITLAARRSVVVIDTAGGKTLWAKAQGGVVPLTIAADAGRVYFMVGPALRCLDVTTGRVLWETKIAAKPPRVQTSLSPTVLVHKDLVYAAVGGKLTALDAGKGKLLWSAPCAPAGYRAPASIFIVNGLIWDVNTGGEPYRPGSNRKGINRKYIGYDLRTGKVRKEIPASGDHGYAIMHHRCHVPRASGRFIITSFPGIEFFDTTTGKATHDSWIRGACVYGFMPANGLLYTPPHPCACYTQGKLTGFLAVAGVRKPPEPKGPTSPKLLKGPAYGKINRSAKGGSIVNRKSNDWPTYRGNAARSGTTAVPVPVAVKELWRTRIGEDISQGVIADGRLFAASVDDHTVHALDAATGKSLWAHTAGGRVDSAPTVYRGTVIFGSRDGYVTCLSAAGGELVWRFRAAPTDSRCVVYDQVESVWPVHGSVLVQDDVLWFCAGRSSYLDGGLLVYRLNPHTGRELSMTRIDSLGPNDQQPPITSSIFARLEMEGAKPDVLSCDGKHVFMRHWALNQAGKSIKQDVDHLFSVTGFLDTSWFRRTYWIYGRMYVSGAQGWARTGNTRPTGRILSIDDDRIFGFGRDYYPPSPGNAHQMYAAGEKEVFFAAAKSGAGQVTPPGEAGTAKGSRRKKARPGRSAGKARKTYQWTTPGDIQVRGMVLAGRGGDKRLIVVGARGDWVISQDAYEGKKGSVLRVISIADGKTIAERDLPGLPVFDGMSAAAGRLYISLEDGSILCLAGKKP